MARLFVVSQEGSTDLNPRSRSWIYIEEVLRRAGVFFETIRPDDIEKVFRAPGAIVVLAGNLRLNTRQRDALASWVKTGGALLGIGGDSGLHDVFGVASESALSEGWMKASAKEHPVTAGLRSSLHVFGGFAVKKGAAKVLAELEGTGPTAKGSAILENRFGNGRALLLAPDLIFSIMHIQQGIRVLQDARPPADGLSPVNDGILKAEDGSVLDWEKDRSPAEPNKDRIFLEPVTDELREVILRSIFHLAREQGTSMAVLWYWPRGLKAVAHMSHDSDSNDPAKAAALLDVMNRCGIKSTWCIIYPGGYPRDFYRALTKQEFEVALHFDAMTGGEKTCWSRENFFLQHDWLKKEAGVDRIATNKNHYTRWEGRLDLMRWCEDAGINSDETRGPSKKGTIGFPLGGSQPYFPLDDESEKTRFLKTMEINLLTQDLVVTCPPEFGPQLMDSALRHHGVGHFLFHPAHILEPGVADALAAVVDYGRSKGAEWWTARQIFEWETKRRTVQGRWRSEGFEVDPRMTLPKATLLVLKPGVGAGTPLVNGRAVQADDWNIYGFEFAALTMDFSEKMNIGWRGV